MTDTTGSDDTDTTFREFNVLQALAPLAEPLREHIDSMRAIIAAAEPFVSAEDVPVEVRTKLFGEGWLIAEAAGIEGLVYVLASLADEGGACASDQDRLIRLSWLGLPGWGRAA